MRGLGRAASMRLSFATSAGVRTVSGSASGLAPCGHGEEEDAPADHRDEGEEFRQPLGGLEPRLLGAAAGLHHLVEHLRLLAQGVPFELLDSGGKIADWQIRHEFRWIGGRSAGGSISRAWI